MDLPSKLIDQIAFNTSPRIGEHMLIVMVKSHQEGHLSQPLQTHNKQFKKTVTFLTGYNGFPNVTNKKMVFVSVFEGAEYNIIDNLPGAYEIYGLNK